MNTQLISKVGMFIGKVGLHVKKHAPTILVATGVAGTVASGVMACKATMKVNEIMEEKNEIVEKIHTCLETMPEKYSEEDSKKDLTIAYTQTGMKLVKLYAPSVLLGAASIASIIFGHNILRKRNALLAAAYTALNTGFKKYRKNVVERFGENLDRELRYGIKAKEVENVVIDENGNEIITKEVVNTIENPLGDISEYARFFDESSTQFRKGTTISKDSGYNLMFLKRNQDYANELLRAQGHVFLNEVYDMLGFERTPKGQKVGWLLDTTKSKGDGYIDFGIYDGTKEGNRLFVNGLERSILLDFNIDGPIIDLI